MDIRVPIAIISLLGQLSLFFSGMLGAFDWWLGSGVLVFTGIACITLALEMSVRCKVIAD